MSSELTLLQALHLCAACIETASDTPAGRALVVAAGDWAKALTGGYVAMPRNTRRGLLGLNAPAKQRRERLLNPARKQRQDAGA